MLHLGLQSLDAHTWLQRDADYDLFHQHKVASYDLHGDKVYTSLSGSEAAQAELHQFIVQHLATHYGLRSESKKSFESLWQTSLLVQEDLCLLEPQPNGRYLLTAASVCSPSNWKLEEKIGGDLDIIHKPVPEYAETLSTRVNRLFSKLKVESPLMRFNWSLQDSNELFWRSDLQGRATAVPPHWYWRVERQTLRRLPKTQVIVFGIRIYLHAVDIVLQKHPDFKRQLQAIIARLPANQVQYKGLARFLQR